MTTVTCTLKMTPEKKIDVLYFTFEFCNYLDLFSTPNDLKPCSNRDLTPVINSRRKYENLDIVAVLQNMHNLVTSVFFFAEDCTKRTN